MTMISYRCAPQGKYIDDNNNNNNNNKVSA